MAGESSIKLFLGMGRRGERLKAAIRQKANENFFGNMSRLLILDFCEKYGYDLHTGLFKKVSTGAPKSVEKPAEEEEKK